MLQQLSILHSCDHIRWISDELFFSMIWHITPWFFLDAAVRRPWDDFLYPNGASFAYTKTIQLKMSLIIEPDLAFIDGTIFKFLDYVGCKFSPTNTFPPSLVTPTVGCCMDAPPLFSWAFYDVLDMHNCWDACQVKVVGWSSKTARIHSLLSSVTTEDFRPEAFFLAFQTLPVDSNLAVNL